jgi:phosphotransferase system, enzyme I, PtsP
MAGDPAAMILLLGMGIDTFSMSAGSLPRIKWLIRGITRKHAQAVLKDALRMENASDIRRLLNSEIEQAGLAGLIRPEK